VSEEETPPPPSPPPPPFAELVAATNYSFLRGASHPSDIVSEAHRLGMTGIGIADRNTVAGVVRAWVALRDAPETARAALSKAKEAAGQSPVLSAAESAACEVDLRLIVGARLVFADGTPDIVAYPATRFGWGRLTRLLTVGNRRAGKGGCLLEISDLFAHLDDLLLIVLTDSSFVATENAAMAAERMPGRHQHQPADPGDNVIPLPGFNPPAAPLAPRYWQPLRNESGLQGTLFRLQRAAPDRVWLGITMPHRGNDRRRFQRLAEMADTLGIPLIATRDALYADAQARPLHDVVTCIREGVKVQQAGRLLAANGERYLLPGDTMVRLFADRLDAVAETVAFLARIKFDLGQLKYEYPHEAVPEGWNAQDWLQNIVLQAALLRYPGGLPGKMCRLLYEEFGLIRARNYAYYFLTVYDVVRFARSVDPPILCQGRGSAANSVVCFLLGVTSVDPMEYDLLFSRFVSSERDEPPDIDVDFEHERREIVMQYIYDRYGRERAGIAATVIHFRPRSAVGEVGKALGLSEDVTSRISSTVWGSFAGEIEDQRFAETGFDLRSPEIARLKLLVDQILQFPRHLSQHVGGFVLTQDRLDETVPIHNGAMADRTFIEWDKDDIDALQLMKVDILALGMLTCIQKSFDLMRQHDLGDHELKSIPQGDVQVYDMLCRGDSIGVFQVESRAQINMLPRLKPRELYDLVIQVAIVRPGPIQGNMVHPYLRRRSKIEKVEYPSPAPECGPADELIDLLGKTEGVPLFQEQAMKLAIVAAKFTPEEANQLRRAMATFRHVGGMEHFERKMVDGMTARGYEEDFARRCFEQIKGFGSYGFPESHALSFAILVYISSWIKCHQPAVFACALLNSQPMGFYAPAQIVRDAREHHVEVRGLDVNASDWDNSLESAGDGAGLALRLGLRVITGFKQSWAVALAEARQAGPYDTIESLARRAHLPQRALRLLADADAFRSLALDRRAALWDVRRTPDAALPLFAAAATRELGEEQDQALPAMSPAEHVVADYQMTRLSLKDHPMRFLRGILDRHHVSSCAAVSAAKNGARVRVAGIVLVRQRPGNGNAIFVTIEDETGITNIVLWARLFETYRRQVMAARLMEVEGEVQRSPEGVIHLMASRVYDRTELLDHLSEIDQAKVRLLRSDAFEHPQPPRYPGAAAPRPARDTARHGHPRDVRILPKSRDFH
jgi:error-prone DNA polymerase